MQNAKAAVAALRRRPALNPILIAARDAAVAAHDATVDDLLSGT